MLRTSIAKSGLMANAAALGCIVVAFVKRDQGTVEGAYLNRSVGGGSGDTFVVSTANLTPWLVAATILLVLGTAALLADSKRLAR
jgi:hypothetical protein